MVEQEPGSVGRRVRAARLSAGLTQKQLAAVLGVTSFTVSRWERGITTPSLSRLRRIAELTATSIGELVRLGEAATGDAAELAAIRAELAETRELVERVAQALERLAPTKGTVDRGRRSRSKAG